MAGARVEKKLPALRVKALREAGKYEDGGGLRLIVEPTGSKRWVVRITINGKRIERGLGACPEVPLEEARAKALSIKRAATAGVDVRIEERARSVAGTTFRRMFEVSFAQRAKQLSNAKHLNQWSHHGDFCVSTDRRCACGRRDTGQVLDVLTPIWFDKAETAKRVLQRMETVFKSAIVRGIRERASPCVGVAEELGTKHREVEHRASLPWQDVPEFVASLRTHISAREFRPMMRIPTFVLAAKAATRTSQSSIELVI